MRRRLLSFFLCATAAVVPSASLGVWIDTDNSAAAVIPGDGVPREIDDALALLMLLHSASLDVVGISTTFGNAPTHATANATRGLLAEHFPNRVVPVYEGSPVPLKNISDDEPLPAVEAMAAAMRGRSYPLDVVALGALTNIAALVRREPLLAQRAIRRVVFVGGRRPQQLFTVGEHPETLPDLNFEKDTDAANEVLRHSGIHVVLCPFELSAQIRIVPNDIHSLATEQRGSGTSAGWAAAVARPWLAHWERTFGVEYFHPFDCLAVLFLTHEDALQCEPGAAAIESGPSDPVSTVQDSHTEGDPSVHGVGVPTKLFLHVRNPGVHAIADEDGRRLGAEVTYCHTPGPAATQLILDGIAGVEHADHDRDEL